jgi:carboxyl-terminal processing protease
MMTDFVEFGKARGVEFNEEEYKVDKEWLRASIEAQVARTLFGNEGQFRVLLQLDPQFQKALTLFPEAKKIAGLH